jgi:catalase-peroxidase
MNGELEMNDMTKGKCPFTGDRIGGAQGSKPTLEDWWPNRLRVEILHRDGRQPSPLPPDFDYSAAFSKLNLAEVKSDIKAFLRSSVPWWPSDYGHYGPQMVRMAWHSAGTYRIADGRGGAGAGMQRFAPINSWEDNSNTDKSRRLLWPIKQKYGAALSWADLIVLTGNCALETMGLKPAGFGGGRHDAWEADDATYWGPECWDGGVMVSRNKRWRGKNGDPDYDLENPLAASHQALIYVNPEGPYANGDPIGSARDIRITFTRMAMNDEETVALIAGGHAFGKSHGMTAKDRIGPPPEAAPMEAMGLGWMNSEGSGNAGYTTTNGIEGSWTPNPIQWDNSYLENLFRYEWVQTRSPVGAIQWTPADADAPKTPDAHAPGLQNPLMMMTSDIALKVDPGYRQICQKFLNDFDALTDAFSKAWYKLTHRDMGPKSRYLGPEVAAEDFLWQDPIPKCDHPVIGDGEIGNLKQKILVSGLSVSDLVSIAWSSAATYRGSDKRGGANGARIRLAPQKDWEVNNPERVVRVVTKLQEIMSEFNGQADGGTKVSLADLIVLGGCAAVEKAAQAAGMDVRVPFTPGRMDAAQESTDVGQFEWLRPVSDGFRNYHEVEFDQVTPESLFLDRAALMTLTAPEWTVLVGGLRVLDTNFDGSKHGVFTRCPGILTNDFFVNLCNMDCRWQKQDETGLRFSLIDRATGEVRFTATRCDLVFGANAQLRNLSEFYAAKDGLARFVTDFVAAWDKVMMLDRYDVKSK